MDVFGAATVAKDVHVLVEEVTSLNFLILDFFGTSVHQLFSSKMTQQSFCALSPAEAKGTQGEKAEGRGKDKGAQSALAEYKLDSGMYTTSIWPHSPQTRRSRVSAWKNCCLGTAPFGASHTHRRMQYLHPKSLVTGQFFFVLASLFSFPMLG